jgi:hypothetical protein
MRLDTERLFTCLSHRGLHEGNVCWWIFVANSARFSPEVLLKIQLLKSDQSFLCTSNSMV